jgi:replication fork protection complex subunit Csm3/Swi3
MDDLDLETYNIDLDLSDDPFDDDAPRKAATAPPKASQTLGLDEQISVTRRAVRPLVKLDEVRLLSSPAGIEKLRRTARAQLLPRLKGRRGHEFADAERLLSFYQLWLDDLFPKARFLDALAMVEKVGHRKAVVTARMGWIEEGRIAAGDVFDPFRPMGDVDGGDKTGEGAGGVGGEPGGQPQGEQPHGERQQQQQQQSQGERTSASRQSSVPLDDEMDGLFDSPPAAAASASRPVGSLFGNSKPPAPTHSAPCDDDEDLDALMAMEEAERAEAEARDKAKTAPAAAASGASRPPDQTPDDYDFADAEAAMAEMDGW